MEQRLAKQGANQKPEARPAEHDGQPRKGGTLVRPSAPQRVTHAQGGQGHGDERGPEIETDPVIRAEHARAQNLDRQHRGAGNRDDDVKEQVWSHAALRRRAGNPADRQDGSITGFREGCRDSCPEKERLPWNYRSCEPGPRWRWPKRTKPPDATCTPFCRDSLEPASPPATWRPRTTCGAFSVT